jgi:hypothetical protein
VILELIDCVPLSGHGGQRRPRPADAGAAPDKGFEDLPDRARGVSTLHLI